MCDSSSPLTVLRSEKDISTSWLEEVLKHSLKSDIEVTHWTSKVPDKKSGFLSEMCFVRVTFKGSKHPTEERSIAIKFAPENKDILEFMRNGNLARKEIEFYKFVTTDDFGEFCERSGLKNPVPQVYWADMEEDLLTLVMHDLGPDGYRVDTPCEGNSLQQIMTTMKSIAVIHACGVVAIKKHGREYLDVPTGDFVDGFLKSGLDIELEMLKGTASEQTIKALYSTREALIKSRHSFFETLIHGDLWSGNVMFSADNSSAVILDWQFACVDNPICDIVSMLLMSGHPSVYEEHLNEVLTTYWESLNESFKKNGDSIDKTFQDLVNAVEEMWTYGFMFFTASLPDLLENNVISRERAKYIISFLENRGVFRKFLQRHGK